MVFVSSLALMVIIPLYENNFYKHSTLSSWRVLTWDDFQGTVRPFTYFDAGIESEIVLDYDSAGIPMAIAVQNDQLSWVKSDGKDSDELLRHEQYHFNITEIFARKFNQFIQNNPGISEWKFTTEFVDIKRQARATQARYDREANHGVNVEKQWLWEYRIDSLLLSYTDQSTALVDHIIGMSAYFPSPPQFYEQIDHSDSIAARAHILQQYGMEMSITVAQTASLNFADFINNINNRNASDSIEVLRVEGRTSGLDLILYRPYGQVISMESWLIRYPNLYRFESKYSSNLEDSSRFAQIAQSFVNSKKDAYQAEFWANQAKKIQTSSIEVIAASDEIDDNDDCTTFGGDLPHGFYGTQIVTYNDSLILPFSIIDHPDSLVKDVILYIEDNFYFADVVDEFALFNISTKELPKKPQWGRIGYTLKSDTNRCAHYYNQSIFIHGN